jgi:predicted amidohydrolase
VRARAIENQVYVIAPDQRGNSTPKLAWHGRSMIVDPWGTVLAQAPDRECCIVADIDLEAQQEIRTRLPSLAHRRASVYESGEPE